MFGFLHRSPVPVASPAVTRIPRAARIARATETLAPAGRKPAPKAEGRLSVREARAAARAAGMSVASYLASSGQPLTGMGLGASATRPVVDPPVTATGPGEGDQDVAKYAQACKACKRRIVAGQAITYRSGSWEHTTHTKPAPVEPAVTSQDTFKAVACMTPTQIVAMFDVASLESAEKLSIELSMKLTDALKLARDKQAGVKRAPRANRAA